jgi:hypothetical protein
MYPTRDTKPTAWLTTRLHAQFISQAEDCTLLDLNRRPLSENFPVVEVLNTVREKLRVYMTDQYMVRLLVAVFMGNTVDYRRVCFLVSKYMASQSFLHLLLILIDTARHSSGRLTVSDCLRPSLQIKSIRAKYLLFWV